MGGGKTDWMRSQENVGRGKERHRMDEELGVGGQGDWEQWGGD